MNTDDHIKVLETPDAARIILPLQPPRFVFSKGGRLEATCAVAFATVAPLILPLFPLLSTAEHPIHLGQLLHPRDAIDMAFAVVAVVFFLTFECLLVALAWSFQRQFRTRPGPQILVDPRFLRQHAWGPMDLFRIPFAEIRGITIVPVQNVRHSRHIPHGNFFVHIAAGRHSRLVGTSLPLHLATELARILAHQFHRFSAVSGPAVFPIRDASLAVAEEPSAVLQRCRVSVVPFAGGVHFAIMCASRQPSYGTRFGDSLMVEPRPVWLGAAQVPLLFVAALLGQCPGLIGTIGKFLAIPLLVTMIFWLAFVLAGCNTYQLTPITLTKTWHLAIFRCFRRNWPTLPSADFHVAPRPLSRGRLHQLFLTTPTHRKIYIATGTPAACNALAELLRIAIASESNG